MLSYRHAFHAGNHADVLKHFVELQLLRYLAQKDKPFWYIDTHAGAGCYELDSEYAGKNAEYESGIARLWHAADLPASLAEYVAMVKYFNPEGVLHLYPGSPLVALDSMREQDRLRLFELHPSDFDILEQNFAGHDTHVLMQKADGFGALKALLPPPPRRALVLIDPPYEEKQDYQRVVSALKEGLRRFATGTYAVWYPQLQRSESQQLPDQLRQLPVKSWLHVALSVQRPSLDGFGMHGSGMFVINPPWTLHATLQEVMPVLASRLGQNGEGSFVLEQQTA
ncbi:MAG: 23S rRNA (adenine(2030)-N(6))-methyltransferase RlmJ [Gammaproteobacteria bacterium]|nr:23S rRNA (adenine(2030)-N(6))-methyltransferase RlmJ [Gammaproteobacteria bacterium]MBU1775696.1 23S rRNA (adenine(2030)-N(6))-methyltransferase RlmJ [Gammaproteobacteria bacterium]MBU1970070.1 23S rRNA (adenine(2030)-N(6))-methyltransferase RlmJ [Gammaproteobacteria bacterium]